MKVLVTVKEVATVTDGFQVTGTAIAGEYLEYDLNEWDAYAIEEAVRIAEAGEDVEVVSVTIGPERSEETVRMALAKGVDRAIRVWDDALEDTALIDVETRARLLGSVVEREDPDLVLTGVQAADDGFGATGVAVAETVGVQWTTVVTDLDLDLDGGTALVRRELEGGIEEVVSVDLPAVLTIQTGINEPRYASLRGIRQARGKPIDVLDLSALDVDPAAVGGFAVGDVSEPDAEGGAELFDGDPAETAPLLADLLRERGVIG